ncbi:MAG TPA: hypothetical protein VFT74_02820 [Isosphaeraceae bacterium]|nr:hypothetical protein [Isosphaeraceae bacterium]
MSEITARLSKGDTRSWEIELDAINVATGELLVTDGDKTRVIKSDQSYNAKGHAGISVYAIDHTNFAVITNA